MGGWVRMMTMMMRSVARVEVEWNGMEVTKGEKRECGLEWRGGGRDAGLKEGDWEM